MSSPYKRKSVRAVGKQSCAEINFSTRKDLNPRLVSCHTGVFFTGWLLGTSGCPQNYTYGHFPRKDTHCFQQIVKRLCGLPPIAPSTPGQKKKSKTTLIILIELFQHVIMLIQLFFCNDHIIFLNTMASEYFTKKKKKKELSWGIKKNRHRIFLLKVIYYFEMSYAPPSDWIKSSMDELFSIFEIFICICYSCRTFHASKLFWGTLYWKYLAVLTSYL